MHKALTYTLAPIAGFVIITGGVSYVQAAQAAPKVHSAQAVCEVGGPGNFCNNAVLDTTQVERR